MSRILVHAAYSFTNAHRVRVSVVSGPNPDDARQHSHYLELTGGPVRDSSGMVKTYADRKSAQGAAQDLRGSR